jgi:hypothetical protein
MYLRTLRAVRPSFFYAIKSLLFVFAMLLAWLVFRTHPAFAQRQLFFNPASLANGKSSVFYNVNSFGADDAVPLSTIFLNNGWGGPFHPKDMNNLDLFWNTDAGATYKTWRIAAFYRGELYLKANNDTVEFLRTIQLKQNLPTGRTFNIDLNARGFTATGLEASKGFDLASIGFPKGLTLGVTARYLKGYMVQQGSLTGTATPTSATTYDFNLALNYMYDHDFIYKRPDTVSGTGDGYSFDLGLNYVINPDISAELVLRDIFGRIYWNNIPYTDATATSQTQFFDSEGYMEFKPTISGYESYKDFTQYIPLKADTSITYHKGPFLISPEVMLIEYEGALYWLNTAYRINSRTWLDFGYNFNFNAFSVGLDYKTFSFALSANDIDFYKTGALGLNLSLAFPL